MTKIPLSLAASFLAVTLHAEDAEVLVQDKPNHGTFSVYFENDLFGNTDQQYTNGVRLAWTSKRLKHFSEESMLGAFGEWLDGVPGIGEAEMERNVAFSLTQLMFTPNDIEATELLEKDRPYAGYLGGGIGLIWKTPHIRNSLVLNVGVVGPWSYAEDTQNFVHDLRDIPRAYGWENQLENEVVFGLSYERTWRFGYELGNSDWSVEGLPSIGATAGTLAVGARTGAELRFGYNMPDTFGTSAINAVATSPTPVESLGAKRWYDSFGAHIFVRGEGKAVAHNIFLDGNTFEDSHSVDKLPFVGELSMGLSLNWRNTSLTYSYVVRTKEFRGQEDEQIFGSLTLNWTF